ncbi:MAG: hypothetical protein KAT54_01195, partial [Candidatus Marinimicrobia bacterium]|nr:hypothetical protein [Candidatus Neomarinimicrobiota bacterium]
MKLAIDCMMVLMTDQLEKSIKELRSKIKDAEKNDADTAPLVLELSQLQKKRHDIRSNIRDIKIG